MDKGLKEYLHGVKELITETQAKTCGMIRCSNLTTRQCYLCGIPVCERSNHVHMSRGKHYCKKHFERLKVCQ